MQFQCADKYYLQSVAQVFNHPTFISLLQWSDLGSDCDINNNSDCDVNP